MVRKDYIIGLKVGEGIIDIIIIFFKLKYNII
jgi:hypothetical protein